MSLKGGVSTAIFRNWKKIINFGRRRLPTVYPNTQENFVYHLIFVTWRSSDKVFHISDLNWSMLSEVFRWIGRTTVDCWATILAQAVLAEQKHVPNFAPGKSFDFKNSWQIIWWDYNTYSVFTQPSFKLIKRMYAIYAMHDLHIRSSTAKNMRQ